MQTLVEETKQSKTFCPPRMSDTLEKIKAFLEDKNNKKFHYNGIVIMMHNSFAGLGLMLRTTVK